MLFGDSKLSDCKIINYRSVGDMVTAEFLHDLYNQKVIELNPVCFRNTICIVENGMFKSFAPQEEWDYVAEVLGEKLISSKKLREDFSKYLERSQKNLSDLIEELENKYSQSKKVGKKEAYYDLQQLHFTALDRIYAINLVQFEHAFGHAITKLAKENGEDVDKLLKSSELTISGQEELKSLKLSIEVSKNNIDLDHAISEHLKLFGSVNLAYGANKKGQDKNISKERIEGLLKIDIRDRIKRIKAITEATIAPKINIQNPILEELSELAKKMGERRDRNKAFMGKVASVRAKVMSEISSISCIDRDDLSSYFLKDIFKLLVKDEKLSSKIINERKERIVLQRQEKEFRGVDAISLSEDVLPTINKKDQTDNIQGITASSGSVKGRVRRVYSIDEAKKINKDEILVAFGTDFDLMVGLQNCAGVITEEGGILSHACVISRELGKPCVINVKNAMNLLQDGYLLEMDADKGSIKILDKGIEAKIANKDLQYFSDTEVEDIGGAKAKNIKILMDAGFPVMPAIVIKIDKETNVSDLSELVLKRFSQEGIITNSYVVRSNTLNEDLEGKSMAGQFDSVECQAEAKLLSSSISKVINSYKRTKTEGLDLETQDNDTVLIQPYYRQKYGGVAFSKHPLTKEEKVIIEASSKGAVVEGKDIVSFVPKDIIEEVENAVKSIELLMGYPVDVEWGYGDEGLKIFQARPIVFKDEINKQKKLIIIAGGEGSRIQEMFNNKAAPFTKHFLPLPEKGGSIIGAVLSKSIDSFNEVEISVSKNTIEFMNANFGSEDKVKVIDDKKMIGPLGPPLLELIATGKRVYACCGDVYSNFDWKEMEEFHENHGGPITILTSKSFPADKAACFNIASNGDVKGWDRKNRSTKDDYINIGGYIIDPDPQLIEIAKELISMKKCKEDLFFEKCIEKGILSAYQEKSFSCNINTPEVYNALVERILTSKKSNGI